MPSETFGSIFSFIGSIFSFIAGEAKYIWDLEGNLEALQTELQKLIEMKDDLLNAVELAEQKPRNRRTNQVKGWLQRVEQKKTKVEKLQRDRDEEIKRLCLGGFCFNGLISSYKFGKRVENLKAEVTGLNHEGRNINVAQKVPEAAAVALPIDQRTVVGQEIIFGQVWSCIKDEDKRVGVIGLYGTGGVGKTTLLKRVNNNFLSVQHHFDVVIYSVVSREPNLKQIQEEIGERIGLSDEAWKRKSVDRKALDISNILSQKKFVLLLDDLWKSIDLTELGVTRQSSKTASKIVFTTCFSDIFGEMQADEKFQVSSLEDGEAWKLFQEVVGKDVLDSRSGIPEQAKILAGTCGGLPLQLVTLGRAMASKTTREEWENAIIDLRTLDSEFSDKEEMVFSDMEEMVLSRLKFSFDSLPNSEIKSCLLYCSLFPEDYSIPKKELVDYWISEGLVDDLHNGSKNINDLVHACLLQEDGDDHVTMHDMIRVMALWISSKVEEGENFLVRAGAQLTEAPKMEEWKEVKRISLMANEIESLTEIPNCPDLQTLLLNDNNIKKFIDGFFQFMPSLRVLSLSENNFIKKLPSGISNLVSLQHLDLSCTGIEELPQELTALVNLRHLDLSYTEIEELPQELQALVNLRHLDLSCTRIEELPQELKALVNLRYLNLDYTFPLSIIPQQLISSFSKLQVFRMREGTFGPIEEEGNSLSEGAESLIKELLCLEHLNLISLTLGNSRAVQTFFKSPKLLSITRSLDIKHSENLINVLHLASMEHLEELRILNGKLEELKKDNTEQMVKVLQSGFRSLRSVSIIDCPVKDLTWFAFAPNLKKLVIDNCDAMEEVISVEKLSEVSERMGELNLFAQLKSLFLWDMGNLKSIYRNPLPFPQLKKIYVSGCPKLKKLPLKSSSAQECQIVIGGEEEWWKELQWEDEATQNAFSPCFKLDT